MSRRALCSWRCTHTSQDPCHLSIRAAMMSYHLVSRRIAPVPLHWVATPRPPSSSWCCRSRVAAVCRAPSRRWCCPARRPPMSCGDLSTPACVERTRPCNQLCRLVFWCCSTAAASPLALFGAPGRSSAPGLACTAVLPPPVAHSLLFTAGRRGAGGGHPGHGPGAAVRCAAAGLGGGGAAAQRRPCICARGRGGRVHLRTEAAHPRVRAGEAPLAALLPEGDTPSILTTYHWWILRVTCCAAMPAVHG